MTTSVRSMGHLALYYRPGCEEAARALLTGLGCELVDNGPAPGRDGFATALFDGPRATHADNLVYIARMGAEQARVEEALAKTLRDLGLEESWREITEWPETRPHLGIRFHALEDLEQALQAVEAHAAPGGPLEGHAQVRRFRARPGLDAETDARMAASPVFRGDEHPAFADHLVQCFVRTDVFGNLTSGGLIELDYAFPRYFERVPTFG
jgi:hypothetical protein